VPPSQPPPASGGGAGRRTGASRPFIPASGSAPTAAKFGPAGARSSSLPRLRGRVGVGAGGATLAPAGALPSPPQAGEAGRGVGKGQAGGRAGQPLRCRRGRARGSILAGLPTHGSTRMTDTLRIAMAQFDFPVGDVAGNASRIAAMIGEARDEFGADVVLCPELAVSGYPPEDLLMRPSFLADCDRAMREVVARAARGIVAVVGWPESAGSVLYNSASVLRDGRIEATYRKRELPNHDVFDERRYFQVDPDGGH